MSDEVSQIKTAKFFHALLVMTKTGKLTWRRIVDEGTYYPGSDNTRSFITEYNGSNILLSKSDSGDTIKCLAMVSTGGTHQIGDENHPALLRLYNFVCSQFPAVEAFIDEIISVIEPPSNRKSGMKYRDYLAYYRREAEMTLSELSEKSGVPKTTLDRIMSGDTISPTLETARRIAIAFGKHIDDFVDY